MTENEWLRAEIDFAELEWARALEVINNPGFDLVALETAKRDRAYWAGYADALNNTYNRIFTPGITE